MGLISFKPIMAYQWMAGNKQTTIRRTLRMKIGELAYLWCNHRIFKGDGAKLRMPIGVSRITHIDQVFITDEQLLVVKRITDPDKSNRKTISYTKSSDLDYFARLDGFNNWSHFLDWFDLSKEPQRCYAGYVYWLQEPQMSYNNNDSFVDYQEAKRFANAASKLFFRPVVINNSYRTIRQHLLDTNTAFDDRGSDCWDDNKF